MIINNFNQNSYIKQNQAQLNKKHTSAFGINGKKLLDIADKASQRALSSKTNTEAERQVQKYKLFRKLGIRKFIEEAKEEAKIWKDALKPTKK